MKPNSTHLYTLINSFVSWNKIYGLSAYAKISKAIKQKSLIKSLIYILNKIEVNRLSWSTPLFIFIYSSLDEIFISSLIPLSVNFVMNLSYIIL